MRSGICANQMCWQWGVAEWGGGHRIGVCSISATRASPSPLLSSSVEPVFSLSLPLFSYAVGVLYQILGGERRGEVSPLYLFLLLSSLLQLHFPPLGFSAPTQFCLPASFPLPAGVVDPLSHLSLQAAGQVGRSQPKL